ncbi:hypothetical protein [Streptomyces ossamyceticus]|uniref:hypothetical protein n=1 Tax=Streptomyces ossamyceticus TaxID=249581 RepID=UPI000B150E65|nr:hypothetical protein [Streptomyces ossamyceticus]
MRHHFRYVDEEGGLWHFEAVPHRGDWIVIKQAEQTQSDRRRRYWWEHLADEYGFLTNQALNPEEEPLEAIPAKEHQRVWTQ